MRLRHRVLGEELDAGAPRPLSAEDQRDLLFTRITRLQELTSALSSAATVEQVVDTSVQSIHRSVGASAVAFCRLDGDAVRVEGSIGLAEEIVESWTSFSVDRPVPVSEAIRTGTPLVYSTIREAFARSPELAGGPTSAEAKAVVALPLRGRSSVLGGIGISFAEERPFDADEMAFLVAAATQAATAYERAAAFESEREARRAAEAANRRLAYLAESTAVLSESLDPETTMQRLAELAIPTLADWCAVHVVEGEYAYPVAMASEDPSVTAMVRDLSERHPVPISAPAGLGAVVRTGEPIVLRSVTMDAIRASTDEREVVDLLSRLTAIAIVPMKLHGRVLGTVTLSNTTDRPLDDADVQLAEELATRAAQAVTNARLYQERTRVAETLQASLLPPSPTVIPGVDVATRFFPAAEGLDVGGDFYDVFRLGTIDDPAATWAIVIGDVRGKGADAAAITGIARATIRAAALDERSPAKMLSRLNQVLLATGQDDTSETGEPRFCTACVATVTPTEGGANLIVAVGGHPLPFVLRARGELETAGELGDLIGVVGEPAIVDVQLHLEPGDSFVLFTDGVTERHDGTRFFDEEGLARVLHECEGAHASAIASRIERAARGFVASEPKDDIAIVVARVPEILSTGTGARLVLPNTERAARLARQFVADALEQTDAVAATDNAVLLTSELVTNALVHGVPELTIEVVPVSSGVRIVVTDADPDLPAMRTATREDEHGRGLMLVEALATRWGIDAHPPGKSVWFELAI